MKAHACKVGATVAACAGDLGARRESSGDRGLGDGKGPSGHDGGSSDGGGGRLGGRARGHHSRYGGGLDPCSGVNVEYSRSAGPRPDTFLHLLPALREVVFSGTLDVCRAFFSDGKVDAVGAAAPANTTSLRGGRAGGDVDPVETPDLVTEDDPRGQASHPSDGLLPGAGGNLPRRDSARNGRESREGLEGSAGAPAPAGGAAGGVGRRSMGELARLFGSTASCHATQAPSDSTQAATAPEGEGRALAGSAATYAGACGSVSTAGACGSAPVGGTFTNTAAVAASFDSGPDVLVDTNAGTEGRCSVQHPVGAKLPSERRVGPPIGGGERGMADSAEPGASGAAKGGEQIFANATSGTTALHGSTAACPYKLHIPAATGLFEFYDHPMESSARLWQLASPASGSKGAASGSLKDHAVPKGQLIARHSAGAALPPREPKPVYASCAESLSVGLAPHVICSACGSSVAVAAPVQDANMKNNQEPDTRHRDPAAGLGLAADQGELFLSSDPETRRELHKRLSHVSQGHVPYWANCEACNRSRGLTPARMRGDRPEKEYQVDQFMHRSRCFIILVHVLAFAVAVTFRPEGMSGREASTYLEPWLAHFGLSRRGDTKPSFYSDPEPLTINIAQALAERYEGHSESFAPERHAPVAERAVRTLKGIVSSHELQLRENGLVLGDDPGTLEFLFRYAAHVHNRFAVCVGSTMSPLQKLRGHDHKPQLTYPFGAVVFAKVSRSSKEEVDAKYARGVYLGPVLGSTGHQVRIRLDSGETKLIVAPGLKLLYPLGYDASLLDGAKPLKLLRGLFLLWTRRDSGSSTFPICREGDLQKNGSENTVAHQSAPAALRRPRSVRCVRRCQRWLRDAVDNALEELDRDPPPAQGPPAKRVRFGDSEVREFSAPSAPSEGEVEVPQIDAEANDHLSDYEPSSLRGRR